MRGHSLVVLRLAVADVLAQLFLQLNVDLMLTRCPLEGAVQVVVQLASVVALDRGGLGPGLAGRNDLVLVQLVVTKLNLLDRPLCLRLLLLLYLLLIRRPWKLENALGNLHEGGRCQS